jgi:hypothetical protein
MEYKNADIIEIIGSENFAKLAEAHGATEIYIPKCREYITRFSEIMGDELAGKLIALCGGSIISLPNNYRDRIRSRNAAIYDDYKRGDSRSKLSIKYGLTGRQLRTIIAKSKIYEAKNVYNKPAYQTQ